MKKTFIAISILFAFLSFHSCATAGSSKVGGLISLDDAIASAIREIESKLPNGSTVAIATITAPRDDIGNYLADELTGSFNRLVTVARDAALMAASLEQQFQLAGFVPDESAVSLGKYLSARAVISGEIKQYESFTQIRLRVVDVETSQTFVYSARIPNNDPVLANIMPPADTIRLAQVSGNALDHLNRGKDLQAKGNFGEAAQEFSRAIAVDNRLVEAYLLRGYVSYLAQEYDRATADFTEAVRLDPNNAAAYGFRALIYNDADSERYDEKQAHADFDQSIKLNPDTAFAYYFRGMRSSGNESIEAFSQAIRINPLFYDAYKERGYTFLWVLNDPDRALADFLQAVKLSPDSLIFLNIAQILYDKGDYDQTIANVTQSIKLSDYEKEMEDYYFWEIFHTGCRVLSKRRV